jgi:L-2-hydroxyglutarate oxidase LhgO
LRNESDVRGSILSSKDTRRWWLIRIVVIGAGILGLATARRLAEKHPAAELIVLEKEDRVAAHQTGHNSGVVHAGLYYEPGSLKARLCRQGAEQIREFSLNHELAFDQCGKLVIATEEAELPRLRELERRARANGVPGIKLIGPSEIREIEPHARGIAALHSPATAVVDYAAVSRALAQDLEAGGADIRFAHSVTAVEEQRASVRVQVASGQELSADLVVTCAGLQSDRIAAASGQPPEPQIVPFRGEYWQLRPERTHLVRGLIYPVPDPALPFLGVHLTKRIDGAILVGPNAVLALSREGYQWRDVRFDDLRQALMWPGTRRLFRRFWRVGMDEMARSVSRARFIAAARRYVPELRDEDVIRSVAGVRAQAIDRDGSMVDDFRIGQSRRTVWIRNAPSPAATASLAIADEIVRRIDQVGEPQTQAR